MFLLALNNLKTPFGETPWLTGRHTTPLVTLFFGTASATDLRELFTVFYSQAFFYLTLLPGFYGAGSSSSKLAGLYADLQNIAPAQLFCWITTIHKIGIVVGSVYGLQLAGYVKNLLITGFELFWRQAVYIKNRMAYLLGHRAIHSEIN